MGGQGVSSGLFPEMAETATAEWENFGNGRVSTLELMSQHMKCKSGDEPNNLPFANDLV
jgi:hypothetical protein